MGLYPITTLLPADAAENPNGIQPGTLIVIPIDMSSLLMTSIILQQLSNTQDFSLRATISIYPDGSPLPTTINGTMSNGIVAPMRALPSPIVLYIEGQTPPANSIAILVKPGIYNLNILNLTNEVNVFAFVKTDTFIMEC